jgi:hypothetical protein
MAGMATEDEEDVPYKGPALRPDGQITGRTPAASPPPELDARFGAMELQRAPSLELELAERPPKKVEPRVERFRDEAPPRQRRFGVWVAALAALLGVGLLAVMLVAPPRASPLGPDGVRANDLVDSLLAGGEKRPLVIESTPPGAVITIAGQKAGVTPWAGDNVYPDGAVVTLDLAGHVRWQGKLRANEAQTLDARLKRGKDVAVDVDVGDLDHGDAPR